MAVVFLERGSAANTMQMASTNFIMDLIAGVVNLRTRM
jgi:hypothetical protein